MRGTFDLQTVMAITKRKTRRKAPHRTNIGSLKLEAPYDKEFKQALTKYGFESVPSFIRQCAFSILKQREAKLILPLEFKTFS